MVLFVAVVALSIIRRVRWFAFFILGFALFLQSGINVVEQRLDSKFAGDSILTQVRVVGFPTIRGGSVSMLIEPLSDIRVPMRSRVTWFDPVDMPEIGDVWELELRLRRPRGSSNPGGFSVEDWMFRERLNASGYVVPGKRNRRLRQEVLSAVELYRRDFVRQTESIAENAAPVVAAIGIGSRHLLSADQWDRYSRTGTSHLMAISGLHIGLAAVAAFCCLVILSGVLRLRGNYLDKALLGSVAAAGAYALVSGFAVPSQRAAVMLLLCAVSILARQRTASFRILAVAAAIVFVADPLSIMAPGFSLSFSAVAVLLWIGRQSFQPGRGRLLRQLLSMQVVLLFGLMPLTVVMFQRVAFVSPVANIVAVPIFSFITVPATLASMFINSVWQDAAMFLLRVAASSINVVDAFIGIFASYRVSDTPIAGVGGHDSALWLFVLLPAFWLLPKGWPGRWLALLGVVAIALYRPSSPPATCFDTHVLDVGQGLAVLVQTRHHALMFDTGASYRGGGSAAANSVVPFLKYRGIRKLDWLLVSHADDDHAGGVEALLAEMPVGQILAGEPLSPLGRPIGRCRAGQRWRVDDVDFEVLHPPYGRNYSGNDGSCVLLVSVGDHRLLLSGDIESLGERELLTRWRHETASAVLIPHHGSLTSSSPALVNRLRPDIAIASSGFANRWGFPKAPVVERWKGANARVLDTGASGAVSFRVCRQAGIQGVHLERVWRRRFWHDPVTL